MGIMIACTFSGICYSSVLCATELLGRHCTHIKPVISDASFGEGNETMKSRKESESANDEQQEIGDSCIKKMKKRKKRKGKKRRQKDTLQANSLCVRTQRETSESKSIETARPSTSVSSKLPTGHEQRTMDSTSIVHRQPLFSSERTNSLKQRAPSSLARKSAPSMMSVDAGLHNGTTSGKATDYPGSRSATQIWRDNKGCKGKVILPAVGNGRQLALKPLHASMEVQTKASHRRPVVFLSQAQSAFLTGQRISAAPPPTPTKGEQLLELIFCSATRRFMAWLSQ